MRYSIVDANEAENRGIKKEYHNINEKGDKMVVNENELRKVDPDINKAAIVLHGEVLSFSELENKVKVWNDEQC